MTNYLKPDRDVPHMYFPTNLMIKNDMEDMKEYGRVNRIPNEDLVYKYNNYKMVTNRDHVYLAMKNEDSIAAQEHLEWFNYRKFLSGPQKTKFKINTKVLINTRQYENNAGKWIDVSCIMNTVELIYSYKTNNVDIEAHKLAVMTFINKYDLPKREYLIVHIDNQRYIFL